MNELFTQFIYLKSGLNIIAILLGIIVSIIFLYKYWDHIFFWRMNYFYLWPFIGRMATHKKNLHLDKKSGWFNGEKQLCADYYTMYWKYAKKNEEFYEACKDYLAKAGETGRNLRPSWIWLVLSIFVFGEAVIFGQLILSFAGELSNNQIQWVSFIVALLIAILLLFLTERTGHELYKNSQIRKINTWSNDDSNRSNNILKPNSNVRLDKNYADDTDQDYQQMLNRLHDVNDKVQPTYFYSIGTLSLILIIAIIAFIERAALNVDMIAETPAGAYATYAFYSLVFFSLQAMGIGLGYLYGFASKDGEKAWRETHKFLTVDDYMEPFHDKANHYEFLAQNRLSTLQKFIKSTIHDNDLEASDKTFLSYVELRNKNNNK